MQESPLHDPDEDKHLQLTKKLLQTGSMYFSYSLDITNSFQRQAQTDPELPYWKRADDRFFWNRFIQTDLIDLRSGSGTSNRHSHGQQPAVDPYILPVMFGMLEVQNAAVKGHPFKFVLISRRSRHRAGTRYFSRGIDENGNVSNFNETEQAIILNDASPGPFGGFAAGDYGNGRVAGSSGKEIQVLSYVQTRGSVPVYWGEMNTLQYTPKLQIRGVESAVRAAKQHFDEQIRLYGDNYLVNLVNQKGRERQVKEAYEKVVRILASSTSEGAYSSDRTDEKIRIIEPDSKSQDYSRLHYVYFDFHNETKGLRWYRAQLLLDQLKDALAAQGYFHGVDMPGYTPSRVDIRRLQTSVVRTNCMDCLDRTNVIQSMLGRWMLSRMLQNLGILREGESSQDDPNFERLFRNVWADNADVVSKSYSGTGALKTDFTRTGDRTKMGMLQDFRSSVTRYMLNNFGDGPRQDAFDVFHGIYLPSSSTAKGTLLFVDKRPTFIQALPYVLAACIFFILTSMLTTRRPDSNVWPLRLLVIFCLLTASWCLRFIWTHGTLYVSIVHDSLRLSLFFEPQYI